MKMSSKKEQRKERKRKKVLAEYELALSNDEIKRPGELLDSAVAKKMKLDTLITNQSGSEPILYKNGETKICIPAKEMKLIKKQLEERKQKILEFETVKSKFQFKRKGEEVQQEGGKKQKLDSHDSTTTLNTTNGDKATLTKEPRPRLSPEEFKLMKQQLKERKKILSQCPRFKLQAAGLSASLTQNNGNRVPVLMCDIQHLLLYALCGNNVINQPARWCALEKYNQITHIVVLVIEGLSTNDFLIHEHLFPKLTNNFCNRVEVLSPSHYGSTVSQELASVPLSVTQKDKLLKKFGTLEAAVSSKEVFKVFRSVFPIHIPQETEQKPVLKREGIPNLPAGDMFSRVYLILSLNQMLSENFPLPIEHQISNKYADFKLTKEKYKEVSDHSPLFAIDCEMCMTEAKSELTRIAVVNEQLEVVYESLVKPKNTIVNYLTRFSGITKEILEDVTTTLEDVQKSLQDILPDDAILVGHSLNCDLEAMQMIHPFVIDTSIIFNMTGYRGRKSKLANLSEYFLKENIQQEKTGHCPTEDAIAAMKLVKLKLSKGYNFGDYSLSQVESKEVQECQLTSSIFSHTRRASKSVALIGTETTLETYKNYSTEENTAAVFVHIPESDHKGTISALKDSAVNHNFALAHLNLSKKLDKVKKSSNPNKYDKFLRKVDKWSDDIYSHTSLNGLCVILFSGPVSEKTILEQKYETNDSDSLIQNPNNNINQTSLNKNDDSMKAQEDPMESSQLEIQVKIETNPRQNGVCFIRINQPKR